MNLYHYCSDEKLDAICESKVLWLTPANSMNDTEDSVHMYNKVWNNLKIHLISIGANDELLEYIESYNKCNAYTFMPYITSFSAMEIYFRNGELMLTMLKVFL